MVPTLRTLVAALLLTAALLFGAATSSVAQTAQQQGSMPSTCLAVASNDYRPPVHRASFMPVQSARAMPEVDIRYVTHSTYRIESPEGVVIATDYSGVSGQGRLPDVVTMNHAHGTHYTNSPDPGIPHVLPGWGPQGGRIDHYLTVGDVLIRNVSTDIYRSGILVEQEGNSIFIFEMAGLCIGHVGHLHHSLTPEHLARVGRLDIVMVPVDGSFTMSIEGMSELVRQFRSSIILPMHWFSGFSLQRFIAEMQQSFPVDIRDGHSMTASLSTLPESPTVVVLSPEFGVGIGGFGLDGR